MREYPSPDHSRYPTPEDNAALYGDSDMRHTERFWTLRLTLLFVFVISSAVTVLVGRAL